MKNSKHTKGGWEAIPNSLIKSQIAIISKENDILLAQVSKTDVPSDEEAEANARLIASAPELLEALIEITDFVNNMVKSKMISDLAGKTIKNRAKNAIKKATE